MAFRDRINQCDENVLQRDDFAAARPRGKCEREREVTNLAV